MIYNIFNGYHKKLAFTHEIEKDNFIPFLDLLIIKERDKLLTEIHKKPTDCDRMLE